MLKPQIGFFFLLLATPAWALPIPLLNRIPLHPAPQSLVSQGTYFPFPTAISVRGLDPLDAAQQGTVETLRDLFGLMPAVSADFGGNFPFQIVFEKSTDLIRPEAYELTSAATGIKVRFGDAAGQFYGAQTVYQLLAYAYFGTDFLRYGETPAEAGAAEARFVPALTIQDHPAYAVRSVMADLGRAPYSLGLLKQLIRIMGQLKLNTLHLHLYDDQLCGFRFARLPLGRENPFAIDAAQLKELVHYARIHQVAVIPELESWGHVQSIIYHYPELAGAPGMYGGASFGVGEKTYALLEKIYDEIVPCLEDTAAVHVGLDEAKWARLPGEENQAETPSRMVGRIHEILMRVAARHGKKITMHLWADHGGRPLPPELNDQVVIEPWKYLGADAPEIKAALVRYGGAGKTPVMMGAGAGSDSPRGTYEASRIWCTAGLQYPNILGVTFCLWESNDLSGRLITLYGGADYAWAPDRAPTVPNDPMGEKLLSRQDREMRTWQRVFPAAAPEAIDALRGPLVVAGHYQWSPFAGRAVAPTVDFVPVFQP